MMQPRTKYEDKQEFRNFVETLVSDLFEGITSEFAQKLRKTMKASVINVPYPLDTF
jgi:hypothetical protein